LSRIFLFALTAALNPTLLTATTVMLLLPNPKRLLLGYLAGAYTTGIVVGVAIVEWLHRSGVVTGAERLPRRERTYRVARKSCLTRRSRPAARITLVLPLFGLTTSIAYESFDSRPETTTPNTTSCPLVSSGSVSSTIASSGIGTVLVI
jgi:hypothetical protein